ncbi:glycoside hydrolase family 13 protein [Clostridium butyricum]|uniref:glycoside hydrolase family 13 protein n=1 Tax=Clostridium butyricum TaxID=1492 RepID=UPI000904077F|nr:glycoside hydrolase family 13 protein [Clostridium butyricum]APF24345.1 neopullulanase 2 [Clostridium butyricum]
MNKYAVYHITDAPYSYPKDLNTLSVIIRTAKDDIKSCRIYYKTRYDWQNPFNIKEMKKSDTNKLFDYYKADISVERNRYRYYFELEDNNGEVEFFDERGFKKQMEKRPEAASFQYPYIAESDAYEKVNWLQEAVVYQIFVERFCDGDKSIDPEEALEWGSDVTTNSKFGGDLQGIIDKLDYLEDLGVNLIYLTPIFKSSSNHKYNTCDYYKIEPQFGTLDKAKELVLKCHERNIKIVFDAVFNHSGSDFFAFKDILKNQQKSKYTNWYFIDNYPVDINKCNYYTFADYISTMPKFNTSNEDVKEYLLNVGAYWINEVGIDGWRLDVCDEVDHCFWRDFKKKIKHSKKDAILIGEIMHESSSFLKGDQLDSIMNYPFKGAMIDFFGNRSINAEEFDDILAKNRVIYMYDINRQLWNLIGSHDTSRFLTECEEKIERMKLAIVFQFTYIGVPYIYYGDEIGLAGGEEPQSRKCMIWDSKEQNCELLEFYKKMIKIRKENKVLIYGDYKTVYCKDNIIAFIREDKDNKVLVIINNTYKKVKINSNKDHEYMNMITGKFELIKDTIEIDSMSYKILKL